MGSARAQQYHSVIFGDKNTWDDWHLIPSSRPEFSAPKAREKYVRIPGKAGCVDLDITNAVMPFPTYENRTGNFQFFVDNDYGYWEDRYTEIREYLHGKVLRAILEDDPDFYYEGRFEVSPWESKKDWSVISINYNVGPFKWDRTSSAEPWLWDPFDFETGVINNTYDLVIDGSSTVTLYGREDYSAPMLTLSSDMEVAVNGTIYSIPAGTTRHPLMIMLPGENTFIFRGHGVATIDYRGGSL